MQTPFKVTAAEVMRAPQGWSSVTCGRCCCSSTSTLSTCLQVRVFVTWRQNHLWLCHTEAASCAMWKLAHSVARTANANIQALSTTLVLEKDGSKKVHNSRPLNHNLMFVLYVLTAFVCHIINQCSMLEKLNINARNCYIKINA